MAGKSNSHQALPWIPWGANTAYQWGTPIRPRFQDASHSLAASQCLLYGPCQALYYQDIWLWALNQYDDVLV
jgi:hypothetical protein